MSLSSVIRYVRALDSAATDGSGKTGLVFGDITAKYNVQGGTLVALTTETITTLGTYQAPTSDVHIRIKELNNTDPTKGIYEVHLHNDQVAIAGKKLWLYLSAAGAAFQPLEVELDKFIAGDQVALIDDAITEDKISANGVNLIQAGLSLASTFAGMTSLPDWLRRIVRAQVGTAGMATAQTEINSGGGTFDGMTDATENLKDGQVVIQEIVEQLADDFVTVPAQLATISANLTTLAASVATGFATVGTAIAAVPLAVWNVLTSALTLVGSIGKWILDNAGGAGSSLTEQQVRDAMKLAPTAGASAEGSIDDTLDELAIAVGAISAGSGAGAFEVNVTIKDADSVIITDCDVILTTDSTSPRIGVYATGITNASGIVTFYVDEGVLYVWRQKGGVNFDDNPLTMTIDSLGGVVIS